MNSRQMLNGLCVSCLAMLAILGTRPAAARSLDTDKTFVASACRTDLNTIKLSQLALARSTNPDVKLLADQLIAGHTNLQHQMMPFADQWGVSEESSLDSGQQAFYDKLSALSGKDFDQVYVRKMEEIHHDTQTKLMAELATTNDKAFRPQIERTQKVIDHLTSSTDRLARKLGIKPAAAEALPI